MNVIDLHQGSRRAVIAGHIWRSADEQEPLTVSDDERLMLLCERLGDVAAAHLRGQRSVDDELVKLLGVAAGWLEAVERRRPE